MIRYELYLDCILIVGGTDMHEMWLERIRKSAKRGFLHLEVDYYVDKVRQFIE